MTIRHKHGFMVADIVLVISLATVIWFLFISYGNTMMSQYQKLYSFFVHQAEYHNLMMMHMKMMTHMPNPFFQKTAYIIQEKSFPVDVLSDHTVNYIMPSASFICVYASHVQKKQLITYYHKRIKQ